MFKVNHTPKGVEINVMTITNYLVEFSEFSCTQNISYDNPQEFSANLAVICTADKFLSLSFRNNQKDEKGSSHVLILINLGDGKLEVQCADAGVGTTCRFLLNSCAAHLEQLLNNIKLASHNFCAAKEMMTSDLTADQTKSLMRSFSVIARAVLSADVHNDYSLKAVSNLFELEAAKFKNVLLINSKENSPAPPDNRKTR